MREDYQKIFLNLKENISLLGAKLSYEDDLVAEFSLPIGWSLVLECEKYYTPTYSIIIKNEIYGAFTVWMLMNVFKDLKKIEYGNPTIENQINFLYKEKDLIFNSSSFYKKKYDLLNTISYD